MSTHPTETKAPFIHPEARVKISLGALIGIIATTIAGVTAWSMTRADVDANMKAIAGHERRFESIDNKLEAQREMLVSQREVLGEIRADLRRANRDR